MKGEIIANANEVPCFGEEMRAVADSADSGLWSLCAPRGGLVVEAFGDVRSGVEKTFSDDADDEDGADE